MDGGMKELMTQLKETNAALTLEITYIEQSIAIENEETRAKEITGHMQNMLIFAEQVRDIAQKVLYQTDPVDVDHSTKYPQESDVTNISLEFAEEVCSSDGANNSDEQLVASKIDCLNDEQAEAVIRASLANVSNNLPVIDADIEASELVHSAEQPDGQLNAISSGLAEHDDVACSDNNDSNEHTYSSDPDHLGIDSPEQGNNENNNSRAPANLGFENPEANSFLPHNYKHHARRLVMEAISQMEVPDNSANQDANGHMINLKNASILHAGSIILDDVQPQIEVEAIEEFVGGDVPVPQRKRRTLPHVQEFLKRRRSMDVRKITPPEHSNERALQKTSIEIKKRAPSRRKTICGKPPVNRVEDEGPTVTKNTDQNAHIASNLWSKLCKYCDKKICSLMHYANEHADHEVPIARPPPNCATVIRKKAHFNKFSFQMKTKVIAGECPICGKKKSSTKFDWAKHILIHTGEKKFMCLDCNTKMDNVYQHSNSCPGKPVNASLSNSKDSIVGFMCNDCNYLQMNQENVVKHMKNEHGYMCPELGANYGKFDLIPSVFKSR